jgi:hypothetical protein
MAVVNNKISIDQPAAKPAHEAKIQSLGVYKS